MPITLPCESSKGSAAVAGVDGGVGLNHALHPVIAFSASIVRPNGTDDAGGEGAVETEWVTDGQDFLADLEMVGIA